MENENQTQNENFENQLTSAAVGFLQESAKWSKFMAIIGFIGIDCESSQLICKGHSNFFVC